MSVTELEAAVDRLLPRVLADRELGDGRSFTRRHLDHLWALSCLHVGECCEQRELAQVVSKRLPPTIQITCNLLA